MINIYMIVLSYMFSPNTEMDDEIFVDEDGNVKVQHASPIDGGKKIDTDESGTNSAEGLSRDHNDSIVEDQGIELKEVSAFNNGTQDSHED